MTKDHAATKDLIGSVALTIDSNHVGWLHVVIFIFQYLNAIFTGQERTNLNLCHGEIIIDLNNKAGKEGQLILAHSLFGGIKTTSDDYRKDKEITGIRFYLPVNERIKQLILKLANQTATDFRTEKLDPKSPDFESRFKKEVGKFSAFDALTAIFHRQVIKPNPQVQQQLALFTADLIKGTKLLDANGEKAALYCTAYMLVITQGASLISALKEEELEELKNLPREEIAKYLVERIQKNDSRDLLSKIYWDNDFMQLDARHSMSYKVADLLDKQVRQEKG